MDTKDFVRCVIGPFSSRYWWFMTEYVILYLLSPFLNKGIEAMGKKDFQLVLVLYTIANVYMGFFFDQFSKNGYSVANFVYLYFIGAYLRRYVPIHKISKTKSIGLYVGCSMLFGLLEILSHYNNIPRYRSYAYNNPILILGAIAFFITFLNIHFKSKWVNWLAYSSLAIYLLPNFYRKEICHNMFMSYVQTSSFLIGIAYMVLILLLYSVVFCLFAMLFDKIRVYTIERWTTSIYEKVIHRY